MDSLGLPNLQGNWEVEVVTTTTSKVAVVGSFQSTTRARLLVQVEQDGRHLKLRGRTQSLRVETTSSMVRTVIPEGFVECLGEVDRRGEVRRTARGWEVIFPKHWEVQGANLRNPEVEPLPTRADDPRVVDQDGDGNPGVTVRVEGVVSGELFVAQRGWDEWRAEIAGDELDPLEVAGPLLWDQEQKILGATNRILRKPLKSTPNFAESEFRMRRLDAAAPGRLAS